MSERLSDADLTHEALARIQWLLVVLIRQSDPEFEVPDGWDW